MKAKKALQAANSNTGYVAWTNQYYLDQTVSFAPLQAATPCNTAECNTVVECYPKEIGNNPMYVENDKKIESSKINYLVDRSVTIMYAKKDLIQETFNLRKPQAPATPEALVDAIVKGNYTIPPKNERCVFDRAINQIVWRAPTVVADQDGADAADKVLSALCKSTQDAIMVKTPEEGLTAVQALDAWTPTVTA